jgi:vesicle coat complex subunit
MGPAAADAVPRFVQDSTDTNSEIRYAAVWTLGFIHARPELAVLALASRLGDTNENVRGIATVNLAAFGSDAKSVVPELVSALTDTSPDVRARAAIALKKIDPEAAAQAGVK